MLKKTLLAVAVFAASSNVFAAVPATDMTAITSVVYANELFGTTGVVYGNDVVLTIKSTDADTIDSGATATLTYTLSSGVFGADPSLALVATEFVAGSSTIADGGQDENFVTFNLQTAKEFVNATTNTLTLTIPSLEKVVSGAVITITPKLEKTNTVSNPFDETITVGGAALTSSNTIIASASPGIALSATSETLSAINVEKQTEFANDLLSQPLFTSVTLANPGTVKGQNGSTNFSLTADDEVVYTLTGDFADNTVVSLCATGDTPCAPIGKVAAASNGYTITLDGDEVTASSIVYTVDGKSTIPVSVFTLSSNVTYDESDYVASASYNTTTVASNTLGLDGLSKTVSVPSITSPSDNTEADNTFVRITNNGSESAITYIQLFDQDGAELGFAPLDGIPAGGTTPFSSAKIAAALDIAGWEGRARAVISSSQTITVVTLMRSAGVLTNQSSSASSQP